MSEEKTIVVICQQIRERSIIENCCNNLGRKLKQYRSISEALPHISNSMIEKIYVDFSALTDYQYDLLRLDSCVNISTNIVLCFKNGHQLIIPNNPMIKIISENFSLTLMLIDLIGEKTFHSKDKSVRTSLLESIAGDSPEAKKIQKFCDNAKSNLNPVLICGSVGSGKRFVSKLINQLDGNHKPFVEISILDLNSIFAREFINPQKAFEIIETKTNLKSNFCLYIKDFHVLDCINQIKFLEFLKDNYLKGFQIRQIRIVFSSIILQANNQVAYYFSSILKGGVLEIPDLCIRKKEIIMLFEYFLTQYLDGASLPNINPEVYSLIENYEWPKNVRELRLAAAQISINYTNGVIETNDLPKYLQFKSFLFSHTKEVVESPHPLEAFEAYYIVEILNSVNGNISKAARQLGVTRNTIKNKLKKVDVNVSDDFSPLLLSV